MGRWVGGSDIALTRVGWSGTDWHRLTQTDTPPGAR